MKGQTEITKTAAEPVSQSLQSNSASHATTQGLLLYISTARVKGVSYRLKKMEYK